MVLEIIMMVTLVGSWKIVTGREHGENIRGAGNVLFLLLDAIYMNLFNL